MYLNATILNYFVILSVPIRWKDVNTKVTCIILAIYRVTFQIVKWNVDDIYFPYMSWTAALQIVSWIVRYHSWSLHKYHQLFQSASAVQRILFDIPYERLPVLIHFSAVLQIRKLRPLDIAKFKTEHDM